MIAADSQSIYWYLASPQRFSDAALESLGTAEDDDGIVVSAWTVPELWMAATRKQASRAVPRDAYELVRATLLDPTTSLSVVAFDERMWPHFEAVSLKLRDPFDSAVVATALTVGIDLVTSDAAIAAADVVAVAW